MPEIVIHDQAMQWGSLGEEVFVEDVAGRSRLGMPVSTRKCPHLFAVECCCGRTLRARPSGELIRWRDGDCVWVTPNSLEDTVWDERATCLPCLEDTLGLAAAQREVFETLLSEEIGPLGKYDDWTALVEKHADMARSLA